VQSGQQLLHALDRDVAFAQISWNGDISRTMDGGKIWEEIYSGIESQLSTVNLTSISESEIWATISWGGEYTFGSLLIHTQDGGVSWDTLLNFEGRDMRDICMLPDRNGWIYTYPPEGLLHTTDGIHWRDDPLPDIEERVLHNLFVLPDSHVWVMAGGLVLKRQGA
ncbi:WD40/YVTN/BNR-like repeat-containing protein, partial [Candidatus Zixiibacteriota bacterium]